MNIHLHCLVLDGVYLKRDRAAVFHEAAAPSTDELETVLLKIITRTMRILTRLGAVIEEPDRTYLAETDTDGALRALQDASCTYRIHLVFTAGDSLHLRDLAATDLQQARHAFELRYWAALAAVKYGSPHIRDTGRYCVNPYWCQLHR